MIASRRAARIGLLLVLALATPSSGSAQIDSAALHATLRGWADDAWLRLLDRGGAIGGRLSSMGILQRFQPLMDNEYQLDLISAPFGLSEEHVWHRRASGARYWGGSINHRDVVAGAEVKATVPLGGSWDATVRLDKQDSPELDRDLVRVQFARSWTSGAFVAALGTLDAVKPNIDLEVRGGYRMGDREISAAVGVLDVFNDVIYQVLVVWEGYADTALDYERQPLTVRAGLEWPLGRRLRAELHAAVLGPTTIRAYRQLAPDEGFRQDEHFVLLGGLLEWSAGPNLRFGGLATQVRAQVDRSPLAAGLATDDYALVEQTRRWGGFGIWQPSPRWQIEGWIAREFRPERRTSQNTGSPVVDYEDRATQGQARARYGRARGFQGDAAFEFDLRDVVRGDGEVPGDPLGQHNTRLRLEAGWRFRGQAAFMIGYRIDLDGDGAGKGAFDGAHGRFVAYW